MRRVRGRSEVVLFIVLVGERTSLDAQNRAAIETAERRRHRAELVDHERIRRVTVQAAAPVNVRFDDDRRAQSLDALVLVEQDRKSRQLQVIRHHRELVVDGGEAQAAGAVRFAEGNDRLAVQVLDDESKDARIEIATEVDDLGLALGPVVAERRREEIRRVEDDLSLVQAEADVANDDLVWAAGAADDLVALEVATLDGVVGLSASCFASPPAHVTASQRDFVEGRSARPARLAAAVLALMIAVEHLETRLDACSVL